MHACVCVPLNVRVKMYKEININKQKPNRDDVTCNTKVEIEVDIHSNVKQAVK